jgi:hypothetical protein
MMKRAARMIDPKTREATAFYAALAVAVWDIYHNGFHLWNSAFLAGLAGIGTAGLLGLAISKKEPSDTEPEA